MVKVRVSLPSQHIYNTILFTIYTGGLIPNIYSLKSVVR